MRILSFLVLFFSVLCSPAKAAFNQDWCTKPLGYQQLTNLASAVGFTSVPAGTIYISVTVEASAIRWRDDIAPTATVGMPVAAGSSFNYTGNFATLKFINQTSGGIINAWFCGS